MEGSELGQNPVVQAAVIFGVGTVAAAINTMAGGGSYLVLPLLVFFGVDPLSANATNRLAICFQTATATVRLARDRVLRWRIAVRVAAVALAGGAGGAALAAALDPGRYRSWMGWLLLVGLVFFLAKRSGAAAAPEGESPGAEPERSARSLLGLLGVALLGVYGGFLGAGVGVMIIFFLTPILRLDLVRMVAVKVLMVGAISVAASVVYLSQGLVDPVTAAPLIVGNVVGGWLGARWTLQAGARRVRWVVAGVAAAMAVALLCGWP